MDYCCKECGNLIPEDKFGIDNEGDNVVDPFPCEYCAKVLESQIRDQIREEYAKFLYGENNE